MASLHRREHKRKPKDIALESVTSTDIDFSDMGEGIDTFQERIEAERPEIRISALESLKKYLNSSSDTLAIEDNIDHLVHLLMGLVVRSQTKEEGELYASTLASLRLAVAGVNSPTFDLALESLADTVKKSETPDQSKIYLVGFLSAFSNDESRERMLALEALLRIFEKNRASLASSPKELISGFVESVILCLSGFKDIEKVETYKERICGIIEYLVQTSDFGIAKSVVELFLTLYHILGRIDDLKEVYGGARQSNQFFYIFNDRLLSLPENLTKKSEKNELTNMIGDMDDNLAEMVITFKSQKVTISTKSQQNLINAIRDLVQGSFDIFMSTNPNISSYFGFSLRNEKDALKDIKRKKEDNARIRTDEKVIREKEVAKNRSKKERQIHGDEEF